MKLEKIVKLLNFEDLDNDMFAEIVSATGINNAFAYENSIPDALETLPKDYLWYLENYGSRTVRNMEYHVHIDENTICFFNFKGLAEPEKACQQYSYQTSTGSYSYRLDDIQEDEFILHTKFLPISKENDGEMLVMDFKDKVGSVWQFPAKENCRIYDLAYQPNFVANSFTEFLKVVRPLDASSYFKEQLMAQGFKEVEECSNVWKKGILTTKELFYKCIDEYEKSTEPNFTEFKDVKEFLNALATNPKKISINESRALELFYLSFGGNWKVKNQKELEENIRKIQNLKSNLNKKRENYSIQNIKQHTNTGYGSIGTDHNFYNSIVKSTVHGLACKETFVFYRHPVTQLLSLVKRVKIDFEDMKIEGIGTFEYDFSWSSKKAKKIQWSKIPATIYLNRYKEDFTDSYFENIRQTINDSSFKETIEQFIYSHYQKYDYSEFLAMDKADKDYFKDSYPKISSPADIWKVLGEEFDVHFIDNRSFDLQFEYLPDDEHGLAITVIEGKLKLNSSS